MVLAFSVAALAIPTPIIEVQTRGSTATTPVAEEVVENYGRKRSNTATDPVAEEVVENYGRKRSNTATDPVAEEVVENYGKL